MSKQTRSLVYSALIAALYVVLTYLQSALLPGSTSMAIQFRASEALMVLAFFTPAAIPGLAVGCLLYNIVNAGALPLDWIVGTLATLAAAVAMWLLRNKKIGALPLAGLELAFYINESGFTWEFFGIQALYVFIGEAAVLLTLGTALYFALTSRGIDKKLF